MSALTVPPTTQPLSVLMRDGSQTEHKEAEGSAFMAELLDGRVNERGYADYLVRFRQVYEALERVGRALAGDPIVDAVLDPALERQRAIEADLEHWGRFASPVVESPATQAYVARIEHTSTWPGLFVAHHYTRYLGDLSGGQAIGRILTRSFDLAAGVGVAFYDFAAIPKPKPYKDAYRSRLDALPLDEASKMRVLAEVKAVFGLNSAIFVELSGHLADYRR